MLKEKLAILHNYTAQKHAHDVITSIVPIRNEIRKACETLRAFLDEGTAVSIDSEIKTALVSIYGILEIADNGLHDESVTALFDLWHEESTAETTPDESAS